MGGGGGGGSEPLVASEPVVNKFIDILITTEYVNNTDFNLPVILINLISMIIF
ncbi:hypothetical protein [Rickettsia helvetica]|uniref:hypothetical protein n=1 Tax=Rickettsia helvetica TaxID=35789 RepID=UPI00030CA719|nr:hypothetical protein [Rickettsia helvetica]